MKKQLLLGLIFTAMCQAQVKLTPSATPAAGFAGVTVENLTGSNFPAGTLSPATTSVTLSRACNGSAVVSATPSVTATVVGTTRRISFALPSTLTAGSYAASVQGTTSTGARFTTASCSVVNVQAQNAFVTVTNGALTLNGEPFRFGGGNSYELMYSSHATIDQVLQTAVDNQLKVVRTWGWIDIGTLSGAGSIRGPSNGFYFQYWDGSKPAYNDGASGLQNLDYEIYRAGQLGLKLIIPFTNNWTDFGGMDQYIEWAGLKYHDQFYTDPTVRGWYEAYIAHLLNRVNTYNGIAYKDDPAIFLWELANEPRCTGSGPSGGGYPSSTTCTTKTLLSWVDAVAPYIKSLDSHHLVSVGDEGFFCNPSSSDWIDNCSQGVDSLAFAKANGIDLMGFHLYPEGWGQTTGWATGYVTQHVADGKALGKPAYMGEYGLMAGNTRNVSYRDWTEAILKGQGEGALFWDLAVGQPGPSSAEAHGSFDIYGGAPLLNTMRNFAEEMAANTDLPFAPVADDQWVTTAYNTPVTLTPIQNDIAYGGASINGTTIDLDPDTPGQQTSVSAYGGAYRVTGSSVDFVPNAGFNGSSQASYTVSDTNGHMSNVAYLNVNVKASQGSPLLMESWETGVDGWTGPGTLSQSTAFHTDGTHSLQVVATSSNWFGASFSTPIDASGRPTLSVDIETTGIGGGTNIAFQSGASNTWCQATNWSSLPRTGQTTLSIPLDAAQLTCYGGSPDFAAISAVHVYLNTGGTYYLDSFRASAAISPDTPVSIESFEQGTDGWHALNGNGTTASSSNNATDGTKSLLITATGSGDWFGHNLSSTLDLTGKRAIEFDVNPLGTGTSVNVSIQSGANYTWCQGNSWPYISGTSTTTQSVAFSNMSCQPDLSQIHAIWIYFNAGSFNLDNVRAQ